MQQHPDIVGASAFERLGEWKTKAYAFVWAFALACLALMLPGIQPPVWAIEVSGDPRLNNGAGTVSVPASNVVLDPGFVIGDFVIAPPTCRVSINFGPNNNCGTNNDSNGVPNSPDGGQDSWTGPDTTEIRHNWGIGSTCNAGGITTGRGDFVREPGVGFDPAGEDITFNLGFHSSGVAAASLTVRITPADLALGNADFQNNCLAAAAAPDVTPPVITAPANITVSNDPGLAGAVVNFAATANDDVDGPVPVTVASTTPTAGLDSGSQFPIGTTTVNLTATDAAGNMANASFTVTVNDTEDPVITPPADINVGTDPGQNTAVVNFMATVTDNVP